MPKFIADETQNKRRIDQILVEVLKISREKVQALIKSGEVTLNDKKPKPWAIRIHYRRILLIYFNHIFYIFYIYLFRSLRPRKLRIHLKILFCPAWAVQ